MYSAFIVYYARRQHHTIILFKVALLAFDCDRGQGPGYFDDVLVPVHTAVGARARLRSADHGDMVVPRSYTVRYGQRSFHSSAPSVWSVERPSV